MPAAVDASRRALQRAAPAAACLRRHVQPPALRGRRPRLRAAPGEIRKPSDHARVVEAIATQQQPVPVRGERRRSSRATGCARPAADAQGARRESVPTARMAPSPSTTATMLSSASILYPQDIWNVGKGAASYTNRMSAVELSIDADERERRAVPGATSCSRMCPTCIFLARGRERSLAHGQADPRLPFVETSAASRAPERRARRAPRRPPREASRSRRRDWRSHAHRAAAGIPAGRDVARDSDRRQASPSFRATMTPTSASRGKIRSRNGRRI